MFEPGQQIGRYELVRRLGGGAFGEVWLVRHLDLGAKRAMKIPTDPDYKRQLRREGQLQLALRHPNVVATIDMNLASDPPWFVIEYVDGTDLRQRLRDGALPRDEALRILEQILGALEAAHAQGILHRDLKPENILLGADGTVKVADFGLGKVQADTAQSLVLSGSMRTVEGKSVSGTIEYMSPQQRRGEEGTPGDDLYALGIIACELLTGERPQLGISVEELFEEAQLDAALAHIVRRALSRPQRRFRSASEMIQALRAAASRAPGPALPPPLPRPAARPRTPAAPAEPDLLTNSIGMKLQRIQAGTFRMGGERCDSEKPVHQVTLTTPFYLGIYPVTQAEYERVVGRNPAHFKGPNRPVEQVSWDEAQAFCRKLSDQEGRAYRLPTEAEWEYACRADSATEYCFGDDEARLGDYAWYDENSGNTTHDVGQKKPNAWGLHDTHGNVYEWCQTLYKAYPYRADDGREDLRGDGRRVVRGGCWSLDAFNCRSAYRSNLTPGHRFNHGLGFRVARPLP